MSEREWVTCPICGESDMRKEPDGDGFIISCVNLACASNGGDNFSALKSRIQSDVQNDLKKQLEDARELLAQSKSGSWMINSSCQNWRERRDAFLSTFKEK